MHDPNAAAVAGLGGIVLFFWAIALAFTIFWVIEIIDVLRRDFRDPTMKIVWLLVVIFLHGLGAILYFLIGKNQGTLR